MKTMNTLFMCLIAGSLLYQVNANAKYVGSASKVQEPILRAELMTAVQKVNSGQKGSKGTVLVVISAADSIPLRNGKVHKTGYFLRELTDPLQEVILAGYDVEFATPGGKTPTVDPNSLKLAWYGFPKVTDAKRRLTEAKGLMTSVDFLSGRQTPQTLETAFAKVENYVGLLVPGGHAPMMDLRYDKTLGAILRHFHNEQKPMAFVCHGPVALLSAKEGTDWPFAGYRVSVVSTADEKLLESNYISLLIGSIAGRMIDYPDQALVEAGAILAVSPIAGTPSFAKDREVISAQNPAAATAVGKILVRTIEERKGERQADTPVAGIASNLTQSDLAKMDRRQLTYLYSVGTVGQIPLGDTAGLGLIFTSYETLNYLTAYIWQGKTFKKTENGVKLVDKILGATEFVNYRVDAQVKVAPSLFDGKPTIQLDYANSEVIVARPIVDEIRKVGPYLYLGRVTYYGYDLGFFTLYFVE